MARIDEARARLAALVADRIDWPAGEGIVIDERWHEPMVAGSGIHLDSLTFTLYDCQPAEGEEVATLLSHHRGLTEADARAALAYVEAHGPILQGWAWRGFLDEGQFAGDNEDRELFIADVRALLAGDRAGEGATSATGEGQGV
jgi:hypothetical protein